MVFNLACGEKELSDTKGSSETYLLVFIIWVNIKNSHLNRSYWKFNKAILQGLNFQDDLKGHGKER